MTKERWAYIKALQVPEPRLVHEASWPMYNDDGVYVGNSRGITYVKPKEENHD